MKQVILGTASHAFWLLSYGKNSCHAISSDDMRICPNWPRIVMECGLWLTRTCLSCHFCRKSGEWKWS